MITYLIALGLSMPSCAGEPFRLPNRTIVCIEKTRNKATGTHYITKDIPEVKRTGVVRPERKFQNKSFARISSRNLRKTAVIYSTQPEDTKARIREAQRLYNLTH